MNRKLKSFLAVTMAASMLACFGACAPDEGENETPGGETPGSGESVDLKDLIHGENDFVNDGIDRRYDFSDYEEEEGPKDFPEDTGTLVSHIYETENMMFTGSSSNGDKNWGHPCIANSLEFSPEFSGNVSPKNLTGQRLTLTVTSDKSVNVPVKVSVSNTFGTASRVGDSLGNYFNISNEYGGRNHTVNLSSAIIPEGGKQVTTNYFTMVDMTFRLNLSQGVNKIAIEVRGGTNIDYFDIQTSATLGENTTPSTWLGDVENQVAISAPTQTAQGSITFVCTLCNPASRKQSNLPALTNPCYTKKEEDGKTKYYLTVCGKEICVSEDNEIEGPVTPPTPDTPAVPDVTPNPNFKADPLPTAGEKLDETKIVSNSNTNFNFWNTDSWSTYSSMGGYNGGTARPTLKGEGEGRYLEFTKASRFELFWVKDGNGTNYHLGDEAAWNSKPPETLYNQEFLYTLTVSASASFDLEIFGLRTSQPDRTSSDATSRSGFVFNFNGNTVLVYGSVSNSTTKSEIQAVGKLAETVNLTDGTQHSIAFSITRHDNAEATYKLFVDGEMVELMQPAGVTSYFTIENGAMKNHSCNKFGQRLSVVPQADENGYATVNIYKADILKVTPVQADNALTEIALPADLRSILPAFVRGKKH